MSFVSYAQNFEDVMLWRALGTIKNGTYIDIGAQDPVKDSVSLAFYHHGWRGLHLEPSLQYATALKQARPDEQVRQAAVGSAQGQLTFYEFADTGLSTGEQHIAEQHIAQGYKPTIHDVEVVTLDQLLEEWQQTSSAGELHWLKIDVEGMEGEVIRGWQDAPVRPWVIVIESHAPGSQQHAHTVWESALVDKGYQFVYSDGINRFYLSNQHPELVNAFAYPPNVFDEFSLSGQASHAFCNQMKHQVHLTEVRAAHAEEKLYHAHQQIAQLERAEQTLRQQQHQLQIASQVQAAEILTLKEALQTRETEIQTLETEMQTLKVENEDYFQQHQELKARIALIENSRSWRITKPLRITVLRARQGKHWLKRVQQDPGQLKAIMNTSINKSLKWLAWQVASRPRLKHIAMALLKRTPWLFERLTRRLSRAAVVSNQESQPLDYHQAKLTGRARHLYRMLNRTPPRANTESRT